MMWIMRSRDLGATVLPVQADALRPPFRSRAFDWVICNNCFPHFDDQARVMLELSRLLTPGGGLVVCHTNSRDGINAHHREVGGLVGGHELPGEAVMRRHFTMAGLAVAVFEDAETHYLVLGRRPA